VQNKSSSKQTVVDFYNRVASYYGGVGPNFFQHCGQRMVQLAGIIPNARVLDVACGRGASLFPAREANGEAGITAGVDLAWEMLRETKNEIDERGLQSVYLSQMLR